MKKWKKALRFALCLLPIGLIGGWFAAEMTLPSVAPNALETAVQQVGTEIPGGLFANRWKDSLKTCQPVRMENE